MKRLMFLLFVFVLALALSAPGYADEPVPDKGPSALAGEPVPPAPVVPTVVDKDQEYRKLRKDILAGQKKMGVLQKSVNGLTEKDGALDNLGQRIEKKINSLSNEGGVLHEIKGKIEALPKNTASTEDVRSVGKSIGNSIWLAGGVLGFIAVAIVLFALSRLQKNLRQDKSANEACIVGQLAKIAASQEQIKEDIEVIPDKTAEKVKQIDMTPLTFETEGHSVEFRLEKDKNGLIKSVCVPRSAKSDHDGAQIPTFSYDNRGKLFSKTLKVITACLADEYNGDDVFSRVQKKSILYAMRDGGPLKIVKLQ